jgi:hypothetical protein
MLAIRPKLVRRYEARLAQQNLTAGQHPRHRQGPRSYLDFIHKYNFTPTDRLSLPAFQEILRAKHQSEFKGKKRARPTDGRVVRGY